QALTEDARPGIAIHTGERPAAEPAIDMDVASGDEFGPRADRSDHHQIAAVGEDPLARSHGIRDQEGASARALALRSLGRCLAALSPFGWQIAATLKRDQSGGKGGSILLDRAVLHADKRQLAPAQLSDEADEVARKTETARLIEIEHEGRIGEKMRRL